MMLFRILIPKGSPQVPRSCGVEVVYKFVEHSNVPQFGFSIN